MKGNSRAGRTRGGNKENGPASHNNQNFFNNGSRSNKWSSGGPNFANAAAANLSISSNTATTSKDLAKNSTTDRSIFNVDSPLLFILTSFVGVKVEVTIKSGGVYEGICHTCQPDGDVGICLKMARKQASDGKKTATTRYEGEVIKNLVISPKEVCAISAKDLDFGSLTRGPVDRESFQTDIAISGNGADIKERVLQKWTSESDAEPSSNDIFTKSHVGQWDQFEANERLYGVKTDFNEEDYTTKLDKSAPDYKKREAEARRLANEIEKSGTGGNNHMIEERGGVTGEDLDEEGRYSAVLQSGRYLPPQQRRQGAIPPQKPNAWTAPPQKLSQAQPSTTPPLVPTTLSSSDRKPSVSQPSTTQPSATPNSQASSNRTTPAINHPPVALVNSSTPSSAPPVSAVVSTSAAASNISKSTSPPPISAPGAKTGVSTSSAPSVRSAVSSLGKLSSASEKKPVPSTVPVAKNHDEVLEDVRQFVVKEQVRVGKEKGHLEARKRELIKKEKEIIFNDFKNFSENFQLKTPMPAELKPMLRKPEMSDSKSDVSAASTSTNHLAEKKKSVSSGTPPSTQSKPVAADASKSSSTTTSMSVTLPTPPGTTGKAEKAKEFRFNLDAVEFKPTGPVEFASQSAPPQVTMPFVAPSVFVPPLATQPFMQPMFEKNGMIPDKTLFIMNRNPPAPPGAIKELFIKNFNKKANSAAKAHQAPPTWPGKGTYKTQISIPAPPEVEGLANAIPAVNAVSMEHQHYGFAYPQSMPPQSYQYQRPNMMGRHPQVPFVPMQAFPPGPIQYFVPQFPPGGPSNMFAPQMMPQPPSQSGSRVYSQKGHNMQQGYRPEMYSPNGRMPPAMVAPPQYQQPPMMYPAEMMPMQSNMMLSQMEWQQDGEPAMQLDPHTQY